MIVAVMRCMAPTAPAELTRGTTGPTGTIKSYHHHPPTPAPGAHNINLLLLLLSSNINPTTDFDTSPGENAEWDGRKSDRAHPRFPTRHAALRHVYVGGREGRRLPQENESGLTQHAATTCHHHY